MTNYTLDGRKSIQSFITNDGYTIDVTKQGKTYSVQVCYKGEQSDANYPLIDGNKAQAQAIVNELMTQKTITAKQAQAIVKIINPKNKQAKTTALIVEALTGAKDFIIDSRSAHVFLTTGKITVSINDIYISVANYDKSLHGNLSHLTLRHGYADKNLLIAAILNAVK